MFIPVVSMEESFTKLKRVTAVFLTLMIIRCIDIELIYIHTYDNKHKLVARHASCGGDAREVLEPEEQQEPARDGSQGCGEAVGCGQKGLHTIVRKCFSR